MTRHVIVILCLLSACSSEGSSSNTTSDVASATADARQAAQDTHSGIAQCAPFSGTGCVVGEALKSFELFDCDGRRYNAVEVLRSHPRALLYFTANWFDPIGSDPIETLNAWHAEFGEEIRFVTILREDQGPASPATPELCRQWTAEKQAEFLVLIDPDDVLTSLCVETTIPSAIALDCDGTVYYQSQKLPAPIEGQPPI